MSHVSHVMTASHLKAIQPTFTNGIPYHVIDQAVLQNLTEIVNKYSRPFDPRLPELDQAFLRLNVIIRHKRSGDVHAMMGEALTQRSITDEIDRVKAQIKTDNPDCIYSDAIVTAWILNEWDRFAVVFELNLLVSNA